MGDDQQFTQICDRCSRLYQASLAYGVCAPCFREQSRNPVGFSTTLAAVRQVAGYQWRTRS